MNAPKDLTLTIPVAIVELPDLTLPERATLAQIYRVASILRQDMANRRKYLDEGVKGIQGRMGGGAQQPNQSTQQDNPNPSGYIVGHKYGGLTYLGGDPNTQSSWRQ